MGAVGKAIGQIFKGAGEVASGWVNVGEAGSYMLQGKDPSPALERAGRKWIAGETRLVSLGTNLGAKNEIDKLGEPMSRGAKEDAARQAFENSPAEVLRRKEEERLAKETVALATQRKQRGAARQRTSALGSTASSASSTSVLGG
jgi:hypothetical protein